MVYRPSLTSTNNILQNIPADPRNAPLLITGLRERHTALDAVHQARERQALQIHLSGTSHLGKEESFSAEQRILEAAHELDVVVYRCREGDQAAGIHPQGFAHG